MKNVTTETIVVGVDGSINSEVALEWAMDEARRSQRPLLIAHAWHWSQDAMSSPMSLTGLVDARKAGSALLRRSAARARREGIPVSTCLLEGSASTRLIEVAQGAAILVVGSRGRRALTRALLGSVSRGVVGRASCPVVVVPARQRVNGVGEAQARGVVAAPSASA